MEACLSAHFVSRALRQLSFEPGIIPAIYVKPFNKGQKNDYSDAEAIAEAALWPNLRSVPETDQFDLQALYRVHSAPSRRAHFRPVWPGSRRTMVCYGNCSNPEDAADRGLSSRFLAST